MSQIITTQNSDGKAIFSNKISEEQKDLPIPLGRMTLLYTSHSFPPNLSKEDDIDQYAHDRAHGLGPGVACPPNGTSASILHMAPGLKSPLRRQPTLGVFYVLEGVITLYLDGGESRTLRAGDAGVIRGSMHSWSNDTPGGGWAKLLSFSQSIKVLDV